MVDMERERAALALQKGPILSFLGAKRAFFPENHGESKATFHSGLHLAEPSYILAPPLWQKVALNRENRCEIVNVRAVHLGFVVKLT